MCECAHERVCVHFSPRSVPCRVCTWWQGAGGGGGPTGTGGGRKGSPQGVPTTQGSFHHDFLSPTPPAATPFPAPCPRPPPRVTPGGSCHRAVPAGSQQPSQLQSGIQRGSRAMSWEGQAPGALRPLLSLLLPLGPPWPGSLSGTTMAGLSPWVPVARLSPWVPHGRALTVGNFVAEPGVGGPSSLGSERPLCSTSVPAREPGERTGGPRVGQEAAQTTALRVSSSLSSWAQRLERPPSSPPTSPPQPAPLTGAR